MKILPLLTVLAVVGSGLGAVESWRPHQHPAQTQRTLYGFTQPVRMMELVAEVSAPVSAVRLEAGERVPANDQPVVVLDATRAELARSRVQAHRDAAAASVKQAQVQQQRARRDQTFYQGEVERIQALADEGRVRRSDFDTAVVASDRAAIQVAQAAADLALAEAGLTQADAAVAEAADLVARHRLHAPSGWVVVERLREPGTVVQPGQPVMQLARVDELKVELRLSEAEVAALRDLPAVPLQFTARPEHDPAPAWLHRVSPVHDPATNKRLVELRLRADDAPEASGGLAVALEVPVTTGGSLVRIPVEFVTGSADRRVVIATDGSRHRVLPVRTDEQGLVITASQLPAGIVLRSPIDR